MNVSRFISSVPYTYTFRACGMSMALHWHRWLLHTACTHSTCSKQFTNILRVLDDCLYPCFVHFIPIQKRYLYVYCKSDNPNGIRVIRIVIFPTHCSSIPNTDIPFVCFAKSLHVRILLYIYIGRYTHIIIYSVSSQHLYGIVLSTYYTAFEIALTTLMQ